MEGYWPQNRQYKLIVESMSWLKKHGEQPRNFGWVFWGEDRVRELMGLSQERAGSIFNRTRSKRTYSSYGPHLLRAAEVSRFGADLPSPAAELTVRKKDRDEKVLPQFEPRPMSDSPEEFEAEILDFLRTTKDIMSYSVNGIGPVAAAKNN